MPETSGISSFSESGVTSRASSFSRSRSSPREATRAGLAEHRPEGAVRAQAAGQRPGVDPFQARHAPARQVGAQILVALPVVRVVGELADQQGGQQRARRLGGRVRDAVVADLGVGQDDHLAAVRRVGADLLVAGHRRAEDDLAVDVDVSAPNERPTKTVPSSRTRAACRSLTGAPRGRPRRRPSSCGQAPEPLAVERRVAALRLELSDVDGPLGAGSMTTRSAAAPTRSVPASSSKTWAGATVSRRISVGRSIWPASTSRISSPNAVSSIEIPGAAWSNSQSLSTLVCGAWSVAMQSIVPSSSPSSSAARSASVRSGGLTRQFVLNGGRPTPVPGDPLVGHHQVVRGHLGGDGDAAWPSPPEPGRPPRPSRCARGGAGRRSRGPARCRGRRRPPRPRRARRAARGCWRPGRRA